MVRSGGEQQAGQSEENQRIELARIPDLVAGGRQKHGQQPETEHE